MIQDDATHFNLTTEAMKALRGPLQVGEDVGGCYKLLGLLGRGGMSRVFEAEDTRLSRKVAIKVVDDAELGGEQLLLEAKALAAIRHDGVPIVHDIGVHRGWTYMVMERVYGIDLERHLMRGCVIDVPEALGILAQTADALAAVHRAGMAHRDLKPGNVMLCAGARVVLLDLGIMLPEIDTGTLVRCGTPRYLAPEVIRGVIARGDAHMVDVYALGAMAFELFAGRPVFDAASIVETLQHHVLTPAPDLSALRPDLPNPLVALVAACLQKDPRERPRDMETVASDLRTMARRLVTRPTTGSGPVVGVRERVRRDVLIIEDDEDIREGLSTILTARGFRVSVAANGREAQDLIARRGRRPNVILLDLMMPVMDGVEFLSQQSTLPSLDGVPVLLVTAQSPANALGFPSVRGVVSKPLAMASLLRRLADLCGEC